MLGSARQDIALKDIKAPKNLRNASGASNRNKFVKKAGITATPPRLNDDLTQHSDAQDLAEQPHPTAVAVPPDNSSSESAQGTVPDPYPRQSKS